MMTCVNCGANVPDGTQFCARCGSNQFLTQQQPEVQQNKQQQWQPQQPPQPQQVPPVYGQPPYSQQPPRTQQPPYVQQPVTQSPENETIIFVCGILGFFLGPIPIIIALVMGKDYNKANNYGGSEKIRVGKLLALIALVLNIVGILGYAVFMIIVFATGFLTTPEISGVFWDSYLLISLIRMLV